MKDKKIHEALKQAQEAVEQANKVLNDVIQELDQDELDQVTGAGDPFEDVPRVDIKPIDEKPRNYGLPV